jgi:ligand-binding sensor domain-containing protein
MAALMIPASGQWADAQVARRLTQPQEFTVDQWTTVDGLPQNSVNAVAQTPDGYIWVGTFGGLARFDGIRFEPAERIDGAGHHVDRVLALAVAPDSSLWIGTENGLLQYRAGRFK